MITDRKDTCASCIYFAGTGYEPFQIGHCRRHAPTLSQKDELVRYGNPDQFKRVAETTWPFVFSHNWCGDYSASQT